MDEREEGMLEAARVALVRLRRCLMMPWFHSGRNASNQAEGLQQKWTKLLFGRCSWMRPWAGALCDASNMTVRLPWDLVGEDVEEMTGGDVGFVPDQVLEANMPVRQNNGSGYVLFQDRLAAVVADPHLLAQSKYGQRPLPATSDDDADGTHEIPSRLAGHSVAAETQPAAEAASREKRGAKRRRKLLAKSLMTKGLGGGRDQVMVLAQDHKNSAAIPQLEDSFNGPTRLRGGWGEDSGEGEGRGRGRIEEDGDDDANDDDDANANALDGIGANDFDGNQLFSSSSSACTSLPLALANATTRHLPNILVTGTPGVGKSSFASELVTMLHRTKPCERNEKEWEQIRIRHVNVGALAAEVARKMSCERDQTRDCWVLDSAAEDEMLDELEIETSSGGCILDFHSNNLFPERWVG
jgi:hypothetical protein